MQGTWIDLLISPLLAHHVFFSFHTARRCVAWHKTMFSYCKLSGNGNASLALLFPKAIQGNHTR
jgi:hypothetical protein